MIYIIGIGPGGSPAYLTSRARQVIPSLHAAVYVGEMIGPDIRSLFGPGKLKTGRIAEAEVLADIKTAATSGVDLAVLVPGDSSLYSGQHGRERTVGQYVVWLRAMGIAFEIIPGVSSWMALCASAGIDMTSFGSAQGIFVVSLERMASTAADGRLNLDSLDESLRYRPSLVLFQSYGCRAELPPLLRRHYPPGTEVVIGYKVSWPEERIIRIPLSAFDVGMLGEDLAKHSIILVLSKTETE
jgi:precorrin-4/cobalt-precorrin-4 C11-methyltransferase